MESNYWIKRVEELETEITKLKKRLDRYENEGTIAVQVWHREDIAAQLELKGYPPTEKNIDLVIDEGRVIDLLTDAGDGNESIWFCIGEVEELLEKREA